VQWLLFLAVLWGAVLIPPWLAERPRDKPVQTMASFHRRLWQLEQLETDHAGSALPLPPRRLHPVGDDGDGDGSDSYEPAGFDDDDDTPGGVSSAGVSRQALRRRRQVFFFLAFAVVGSLGAVVGLRTVTAIYVHIGALVLFTGYVTLLVRHHQRVAERDSKVRYLSPIREPRPAVVVLRSGTAR
jgi:hypothetical protein